MEIIPAIDIRAGRCVRLIQGDFDRETVFGADPPQIAREWARQGATRLHVVDLDGAREGFPVNQTVVEAVIAAVSIPVEVSGGIRDESAALAYRRAGAARVVIGTAAVEDRPLVRRLARELGEALVVGIDAKNGVVMTRGWLDNGHVSAVALTAELARDGVRRFEYTDVERDGMPDGPNVAALSELIQAAGRPVIAAGGISAIAHVRAVQRAGAEGAIVGTALYTGALSLAAAMKAANKL